MELWTDHIGHVGSDMSSMLLGLRDPCFLDADSVAQKHKRVSRNREREEVSRARVRRPPGG